MTHRGPRPRYSILAALREDLEACRALSDHMAACGACSKTELCADGLELYEGFKLVQARGRASGHDFDLSEAD